MVQRRPRNDWTSLLLGDGPEGVPCIRKAGKEYWEFPGGKRHAKDRDSRFTAVRENREETGMRIRIETIRLVGSSDEYSQHSHQPFRVDLFHTVLTSKQIASHFVISKEGEEVGVFTWKQLNEMAERGTFSPYHCALCKRFGLWRKA